MKLTKKVKSKLKDLGYNLAVKYADNRKGEPFHPKYKKEKDAFRVLMANQILLERKIKKHYKGLNEDIIANLDWGKWEIEKRIKASEFVSDFVFTASIIAVAQMIESSMRGTFQAGIEAGKSDLGTTDMFDESDPVAMAALWQYSLSQAKHIKDTTDGRIDAVLLKAASLGWTRDQTEAEISRVLNDDRRFEGIVDVLTIGMFVLGKVVYDKWVKADTGRRWLTRQDGKVCMVCRGLHNEVKVKNEKFITQYGFVKGPPAHGNCRCYLELINM